MTAMSVSEARAALPRLLERVDQGEEITITRHGRPIAVLVGVGALRARRASSAFAGAQRLHELVNAAAADPGGSISTERAEDLIDDIRRGRDER
ncbi:type II toxin-antitoxin system Phd/YefM family antitoxin [uncultured Jatrophihabitans sp.]|uniref:type II toxin-antitoxin system Phd/YefM family antitoxin n=1 Tax=uncultured Jatrophihabitans sp. TaxID=1610747 RepID=UPI0035CC4500